MKPAQIDALREIRRLLNEAYTDWQNRTDDGHCQRSEGYVEVCYPNWFDERDGADPMEAKGLSIYSSVLGPSGTHGFLRKSHPTQASDHRCSYSDDPFSAALEAVREWHAEQLAKGYGDDGCGSGADRL